MVVLQGTFRSAITNQPNSMTVKGGYVLESLLCHARVKLFVPAWKHIGKMVTDPSDSNYTW